MSVIISGLSSTHRDFSDAENAAIDAASFSLSEGNWREHLDELFSGDASGLDMPACSIEHAAAAYIGHYENDQLENEHIRWHVRVARKTLALAEATLASGGDTVGVAG